MFFFYLKGVVKNVSICLFSSYMSMSGTSIRQRIGISKNNSHNLSIEIECNFLRMTNITYFKF